MSTRRDTPIYFSPITQQLQIKTLLAATTSSGTYLTTGVVFLRFEDKKGEIVGGIRIEISSQPRYRVIGCTDWIDLQGLPRELEKVWTVSLVANILLLDCNEEEVAKITLSDETCSDSNDGGYKNWIRLTEKITFDNELDNASDFYRLAPIKG